MEALQGKSLTQQEKEKLKEQLAYLKREYSKTFLRLQRAERAEKVKNYVKKTVAEQNEFLLQKEAEKKDPEGSSLLPALSQDAGQGWEEDLRTTRKWVVKTDETLRKIENSAVSTFKESISQTSPRVCKRVLASDILEPSTAESTSISLRHEPAVVIRGDSLLENSGSECSTPDPESIFFCPIGSQPEKKPNRLSRSGSKARRRAALALEERGDSACDVFRENAGREWECETASIGSSGSPTFKRRCSILESDQSIPNSSSAAEGGNHGVAVVEPQSQMLGKNVCLRVSSPLSNALSYENRVPSLHYLCEEGVFANSEGSAVKTLVSHSDTRRGEQESVRKEEQPVWVGEEEPGRTAGVVGTSEAFRGGGTTPHVPGLEVPEERSQCEETCNLDLENRGTSLSKTGEMGLERQGEAGSPLLKEALPTVPTKSPLSSCTVVEGLLFPVEYYVRTTRRMSSCQREVNLAAILQGQLGKRRREQGVSRKERDACPALSSQEPEGSHDQPRAVPFPPHSTCVDPGCEAASPLQSLPVSNAQRQGLIQHRRGRRPRGRSRHRAAPSTSPEVFANSEQPTCKDSSCLMLCEARGQGAVFPVVASDSPEARLAGGKPPAEPAFAAGRCPEAELESVQYSCATMLGTKSAFNSARGLEVAGKVCCPERKVQKQEGHWSSIGADLVPLDAAPLPQCEPLAAAPKRVVGRASRGANLSCIDDTVLLNEDVVPNVQREESNSGGGGQGREGETNDYDELVHLLHLRHSATTKLLRTKQQDKLDYAYVQSQTRQSAASSTGAATQMVLEEQDMPWTAPVSALGGKGSVLHVRSRGHPESEMVSQKCLPSQLHLQESHVPGDEGGLPEPDKTEACAVEQLEVFDSVRSVESLWCAGNAAPGEGSSAGENLCSASLEPPVSPPLQRLLHKKGFPSRELLLSPALEGISSPLESQLPTTVFPLVGATPASQTLPSVSPLQVEGNHTVQSRSEPQDGTRQRPEEAAGVGFEESQLSAGESAEHCKESPKQIEAATEDTAEALRNSQREWNLQMTSKLKASSSSCSLDMSTVWWGATGLAEFCIAIACETSVSLWRRLVAGHWGELHTWHFAEVPVSQIVPLPDVHSLLCVALGGWEMAQIRFLFQSSEDDCTEQSQVKAGNIKAVLGLKNRRLVICCGSLQNQTVEVVSFSEAGRSQKTQSLMPPKENILTFAEVDGMQDALVGLTDVNCVVVWNLKTGQLLRRIPVGQSDPASVCHKAFSDSGLLFVVLSCPHTKESEARGTAAFQVIALNPKTARSTRVVDLSLPPGIAGRWSVVDDCLLARRTDGSIYVYSYIARLPFP